MSTHRNFFYIYIFLRLQYLGEEYLACYLKRMRASMKNRKNRELAYTTTDPRGLIG